MHRRTWSSYAKLAKNLFEPKTPAPPTGSNQHMLTARDAVEDRSVLAEICMTDEVTSYMYMVSGLNVQQEADSAVGVCACAHRRTRKLSFTYSGWVIVIIRIIIIITDNGNGEFMRSVRVRIYTVIDVDKGVAVDDLHHLVINWHSFRLFWFENIVRRGLILSFWYSDWYSGLYWYHWMWDK